MGCFSVFPCFTNRKVSKSVNPTTPASTTNQGNAINYEPVLIKIPTQESTNLAPFLKTRDDSEDVLIKESEGKTVAIDLDVESDECISVEEKNVRRDSGKLGFLVQIENEKEREKEEEKEIGKLGVLVQIENEKERKNEPKDGEERFEVQVESENEMMMESDPKEENQSLGVGVELENEKEVQSQAVSDSSVSSYISYPPMHRYHNYVINEDDDEDEDGDHLVLIQEESSESLFSLSIDQRKQSKSCQVEADDKEVNSPMKISYSPELFEINDINAPFKVSSDPELIAKPDRSCAEGNDHNQKIDSLLNPIENLAQWKTLKARPIPISGNQQEKENVFLEEEEIPTILSEEPISKVPDRKGKVKTDTAVTTSLSSWLVEPEKSTVSKEESQSQSQYSTGNSYSCSAYSDGATSWKSFEDRPILGAWTIDEVKQISARSSPRKSPSHNPDETPIIGSVGSYWSHTGQATDSSNSYSSPRGMSAKSRRNRENKAKSCHSSPSKRRLDRAFDKTAARVNL